ncbi:terminase [Nocardiopsis sp. CNR-923]|uniref:terminase n=1 Tax=Nocardiopsis sp. CNR-923 TaxID=1904965 RepID=UPI0016510C43|nr:terminase [Nocardiopsis sp. CNR-923]
MTMPEGLPELTLGWEVIRWAVKYLKQPNGPHAGRRWEFVDSQVRFILWWYALDESGRWLYTHGVRRLAKGSGKSPFAALLALAELTAPVRLADFDPQVPGGCVGKPVQMPLVQIAATAESQTENTMRMVRALAPKGSRIVADFGLDPGKTQYYRQPEGQLAVMTSSSAAAEGGEASCIVADETEHWLPGNGGPEFAATLADNLAKSGSRMLETCNAWKPEKGSVAEASYNAWLLQEEGRTRAEDRILYDARVAPPDTDMADEASLMRALDWVYGDCWWVDRRFIANRIWQGTSSPDDSERKYLNRPTEAKDAWLKAAQWSACADPSVELADGEQVALAADLSKSRDATAIILCRVSDGHLFTWDVWEPPLDPDEAEHWEVPRRELDARVAQAFERFDIVAFYAEPGPLLSYVDLWGERYGDRVCMRAHPKNPVRFDMRSTQDGRAHPAVLRRFTDAAMSLHDAIVNGDVTHDGDPRLHRHMVNARRWPNNYGTGIGKSSRHSSAKVDAAVTAVIARLARTEYLALPESRRRKAPTSRKVVVFRGRGGRARAARARRR